MAALAYWKQIAAAVLLALAGWCLYHAGVNSEKAETVKAKAALREAATALRVARDAIRDSEAARAKEADAAKRANAVAEQYEKDKQDAEKSGKRVADDLRAGNLWLRKQWRGCEDRVPEAGAGSGEPDAAADDRAESAGRIVRAAEEADAQIRALQDFIRESMK